MARLSFVVQHLVFCTSVEYPNVSRPQRDSSLHGVDYVFGVPPSTEFPFEPEEFWLHARFFSLRDQPFDTRGLFVTCVWRNHPSGQETDIWTHALGPISFRRPQAVLDRGWAFRNTESDRKFRFPGAGAYEFRLWHRTRKWPHERVKAHEYIKLEVQP